jgi:Zn-dependent protease
MEVSLSQGYLRFAREARPVFRIHWTLPLGMAIFTRFHFVPYAWAACVALIVFHELGHAAVVRAFRLRVVGIDLHGAGGLCHWSGDATPLQAAVIAWGGIMAQLVVLVPSLALYLVLHPMPVAVEEVLSTLIFTNLALGLFNLMPIRPFDGYRAWGLFPLLRAARRARATQNRRAKALAEMAGEAKRSSERKQLRSPEQVEALRRVYGPLVDELGVRVEEDDEP